MAEFSPVARLLATLLLLALSLAAWKLVLHPSRRSETEPTPVSARSEAKRRPRKKQKKKSKPQAEEVPGEEAPVQAKQEAQEPQQSNSDSDNDARPASKQLATRRFKPAALGPAKAAPITLQAPRLELDQRVEARFQGGNDWFPAVVTEVRRGNTYHLRYDDGEVEFHVPAELIRVEGQAAEPKSTREEALRDVASSESDESSSEGEDDGWEVVGKAKNAKKPPVEAPDNLVDGLTKRQRENRRKKERQREIKEMARRQAQEGEFDARARMKYVPPPTAQ